MSKRNRANSLQITHMKALIIYDDFFSATKANAILQHLRNSTIKVHWIIRPWRVDMLGWPITAGEALNEAKDAHLIVLAGRCSQSLPFWLQNWLEHWVKISQVEGAALAVVIARSRDAISMSQSDLSQFANNHGLSVIIDGGGALESDSLLHEEDLKEPKLSKSSILPQRLNTKNYDEYRNWGIND
jgi:hypothetical protein